MLAGIPERIGYYTKKRALLLTKKVAIPQETLHKVEYFLNIAKASGITAENKDYEFFVNKEDSAYIDDLFTEYNLRSTDFLVVINPGGNWQLKRWPKENFSKLSDRLIKEYGAKVIISGAQGDFGLAKDIAAHMQERPIILCGKTTLGQLAALMSKVHLVISNDSGPMHIAVSQKAKVIALFGPTSPGVSGPYGRGEYLVIQAQGDCEVPCYKLDCADNKCMVEITVAEVLQATEKLTGVLKNENR